MFRCVGMLVMLVAFWLAPPAQAERCPRVRDWSALQRKAERGFARALRPRLARKTGLSRAELERRVRLEARRKARRHVAEVRARLRRHCSPRVPSLL